MPIFNKYLFGTIINNTTNSQVHTVQFKKITIHITRTGSTTTTTIESIQAITVRLFVLPMTPKTRTKTTKIFKKTKITKAIYISIIHPF